MPYHKSNLILFALLIFHFSLSSQADEKTKDKNNAYPKKDWIFLNNGKIKIGLKKTSGLALGYFSNSDSNKNILNHYDHGRLVQQSYYGDLDGSKWRGKDWHWNPIQGGDWKGKAAKILEIKKSKNKIYSNTHPVHWATGKLMKDVIFEQTISIEGTYVKIDFKMTYKGKKTHKVRDQEIPAFFVEPEYKYLIRYHGKKPWTKDKLNRSVPGWPNERHPLPENWAAYVNEKDYGIGCYVPKAKILTCYRFLEAKVSSCSYFSPLIRFGVKPGMEFKYTAYIISGKTDFIRKTIYKIKKNLEK